jgi:2-methylisocitrate lyase-like PEP mutase family enzyme
MYKTGTKISWVWGKVNMMETGDELLITRDELTAHGVRVETFRMMAAKIGGEICARYKTKVKEEGLLVKRLPCCTRLLSDQQHSQVLSQSHP